MDEAARPEPRGEEKAGRQQSAVSGEARKRKQEETPPPRVKHFPFGSQLPSGEMRYQCHLNVPSNGPPAKLFYTCGFQYVEQETLGERKIMIWDGENWLSIGRGLRPLFASAYELSRFETEVDLHSLHDV